MPEARVSEVGMVIALAPARVEVPLNTRTPVPAKVVAPDTVSVPLTVRLEDSVSELVPDKVTLFQLMPAVLSVVDAATFSVEPVVTTVPAVYVRVPVS